MSMEYGSAFSSVCVGFSGSCQMAQSAIQAVKNLEHTYGIPASKIAVTPMIGMNDATTEIFTTADVNTLTSYAVSNGLAGLHFWSLDRDTPCSYTYASPTCNSISSTTPLQYTKQFLSDLGYCRRTHSGPRTVPRARPAYSSGDLPGPGWETPLRPAAGQGPPCGPRPPRR